MIGSLIAIIACAINVAFFAWFGNTLTSINENLKVIADHTKRQTKMMAFVANASIDATSAEETRCQPVPVVAPALRPATVLSDHDESVHPGVTFIR
jgi:hypothetical protein